MKKRERDRLRQLLDKLLSEVDEAASLDDTGVLETTDVMHLEDAIGDIVSIQDKLAEAAAG